MLICTSKYEETKSSLISFHSSRACDSAKLSMIEVDLEPCWDGSVYDLNSYFDYAYFINYCLWSPNALIIDSDSIIGLLGALINASLGMSGSDSEDINDS